MATDEPEVITLEDRINALEVELARLRETPGTLGWPNDPTIAQGFAAHRWQRRDGATPTGGLPPTYVSEAPADGYYYGRYNFTWQQVVEEAPNLTTRRSVAGYARAPFGSPVTWMNLDDVLASYLTDAPADQYTWGRRNGNWQQLEQVFASTTSPMFLGTPTAPTPPNGDASTRLATTQFVADNAGSGGGGIPDVPAVNGAYARTYLAGEAGWTDFNALGVAGLSSPAFTGVPTAPTGGAGLNTNQLATTAWVQNQFNVRDYLSRNGGSMDGPLITVAGTGPTNPGIGIGDNSTGFFRSGPGLLNVSAGGVGIAQFMAQVAAFFVPVNVGNNPINSVGDPAQPMDGLNLRTGDSRYLQPAVGGFITAPTQILVAPVIPNDIANKLYVDQRRAPPVVYDIPANVAVPGDSQWHQIASVPVSIPRGGPSLIMVSVSCNVSDLPNIGLIGVRLLSGTPERRAFTYGGGPPDNATSGFFATFTTNIVGDALSVPVEVIALSLGGAPPSFTVVGGGPSVALRSQVVIVDLGPITTGEETNAAESQADPSGAGRSQRRTVRPHNRRSA